MQYWLVVKCSKRIWHINLSVRDKLILDDFLLSAIFFSTWECEIVVCGVLLDVCIPSLLEMYFGFLIWSFECLCRKIELIKVVLGKYCCLKCLTCRLWNNLLCYRSLVLLIF